MSTILAASAAGLIAVTPLAGAQSDHEPKTLWLTAAVGSQRAVSISDKQSDGGWRLDSSRPISVSLDWGRASQAFGARVHRTVSPMTFEGASCPGCRGKIQALSLIGAYHRSGPLGETQIRQFVELGAGLTRWSGLRGTGSHDIEATDAEDGGDLKGPTSALVELGDPRPDGIPHRDGDARKPCVQDLVDVEGIAGGDPVELPGIDPGISREALDTGRRARPHCSLVIAGETLNDRVRQSARGCECRALGQTGTTGARQPQEDKEETMFGSVCRRYGPQLGVAALIAAVLVLASLPAESGEGKVTLRLAYGVTEKSALGRNIEVFAKRVAELTNGQVTVRSSHRSGRRTSPLCVITLCCKVNRVDRDFVFLMSSYDIDPGSFTPKVSTIDGRKWPTKAPTFTTQ